MAETGAGADLPLVILGVDHHRTPVAVRERLAVPETALRGLLATLSTLPGASEAVVLSSCRRAIDALMVP